jgi:hypothetical protein
LDWARKLTDGDWLADAEGNRYQVAHNDVDHDRIDLLCVHATAVDQLSAWAYEGFIKAALDHKFERICRNCKRKRKEHLKKAKCLFGATSWA